jgi:hypothetical protein
MAPPGRLLLKLKCVVTDDQWASLTSFCTQAGIRLDVLERTELKSVNHLESLVRRRSPGQAETPNPNPNQASADPRFLIV